MKIRIVQQPAGEVFGIDLKRFRIDAVYDLAPSLAQYLCVEGFAVPEMRSDDGPRPNQDRRRRPRAGS